MTRICLLACAGLAISTAAAAQNPSKPISRNDYVNVVDTHFKGADANHDGQLTKAELVGQQEKDIANARERLKADFAGKFKQLDTNHDGKLSLEEFEAGAPGVKSNESADQMIARLDANHDGKISAEEFRNPELAKFNKVDANHDGIVTPDEQRAAAGR